MTQERQPIRRIEFPTSQNIFGKTFKQLPSQEQRRKCFENLVMHYLPAMEVVEIASDNLPTIWIPRDQVFMMEPEQEMAAMSPHGPAEPVAVPVEAPVLPEGARSNLSAPPPDLRPPPKAERYAMPVKTERDAERVSHDTLTDDPKPDKWSSIGKRKPGRPKKGSK